MTRVSLHLHYVYVARMLEGQALAIRRERIRRVASDRVSDALRASGAIPANGINSPMVHRSAVEKDVAAIRGPHRCFVRPDANREARRDIARQISHPDIHIGPRGELVHEPLAVGRQTWRV